MGAYNWIELEAVCPSCGESAIVRAQTHVASSFDGDERGRFHDCTYKLADKLAWWGPDHRDHGEWRVGGRLDDSLPGGVDEEACTAACARCGAELCAVIRFEDTVATALLSLTVESDWPAEYKK